MNFNTGASAENPRCHVVRFAFRAFASEMKKKENLS